VGPTSHWTKSGSVWVERQVRAGTELFTLWFKGELSAGTELNLGTYLTAERAAASIAYGEHDFSGEYNFSAPYDFQVSFELSKLGIPSHLKDWNGFK
jgi:hypothetical protein